MKRSIIRKLSLKNMTIIFFAFYSQMVVFSMIQEKNGSEDQINNQNTSEISKKSEEKQINMIKARADKNKQYLNTLAIFLRLQYQEKKDYSILDDFFILGIPTDANYSRRGYVPSKVFQKIIGSDEGKIKSSILASFDKISWNTENKPTNLIDFFIKADKLINVDLRLCRDDSYKAMRNLISCDKDSYHEAYLISLYDSMARFIKLNCDKDLFQSLVKSRQSSNLKWMLSCLSKNLLKQTEKSTCYLGTFIPLNVPKSYEGEFGNIKCNFSTFHIPHLGQNINHVIGLNSSKIKKKETNSSEKIETNLYERVAIKEITNNKNNFDAEYYLLRDLQWLDYSIFRLGLTDRERLAADFLTFYIRCMDAEGKIEYNKAGDSNDALGNFIGSENYQKLKDRVNFLKNEISNLNQDTNTTETNETKSRIVDALAKFYKCFYICGNGRTMNDYDPYIDGCDQCYHYDCEKYKIDDVDLRVVLCELTSSEWRCKYRRSRRALVRPRIVHPWSVNFVSDQYEPSTRKYMEWVCRNMGWVYIYDENEIYIDHQDEMIDASINLLWEKDRRSWCEYAGKTVGIGGKGSKAIDEYITACFQYIIKKHKDEELLKEFYPEEKKGNFFLPIYHDSYNKSKIMRKKVTYIVQSYLTNIFETIKQCIILAYDQGMTTTQREGSLDKVFLNEAALFTPFTDIFYEKEIEERKNKTINNNAIANKEGNAPTDANKEKYTLTGDDLLKKAYENKQPMGDTLRQVLANDSNRYVFNLFSQLPSSTNESSPEAEVGSKIDNFLAYSLVKVDTPRKCATSENSEGNTKLKFPVDFSHMVLSKCNFEFILNQLNGSTLEENYEEYISQLCKQYKFKGDIYCINVNLTTEEVEDIYERFNVYLKRITGNNFYENSPGFFDYNDNILKHPGDFFSVIDVLEGNLIRKSPLFKKAEPEPKREKRTQKQVDYNPKRQKIKYSNFTLPRMKHYKTMTDKLADKEVFRCVEIRGYLDLKSMFFLFSRYYRGLIPNLNYKITVRSNNDEVKRNVIIAIKRIGITHHECVDDRVIFYKKKH